MAAGDGLGSEELLESCRTGEPLRGLRGTGEKLGPERESAAASPGSCVRMCGGRGMWEPHTFV